MKRFLMLVAVAVAATLPAVILRFGGWRPCPSPRRAGPSVTAAPTVLAAPLERILAFGYEFYLGGLASTLPCSSAFRLGRPSIRTNQVAYHRRQH